MKIYEKLAGDRKAGLIKWKISFTPTLKQKRRGLLRFFP